MLFSSCANTSTSSKGSTGSTDSTSSEVAQRGGAGDPVAPATELSSILRLTDMAATLNAKGVACALEYEALTDEATGRKELSLCTIDGELATLVIWNDPASVTRFVASATAAGDVIAYGRQWTVSITEPTIAQRVAVALGGRTLAPTNRNGQGTGATAGKGATAGTSGQLSGG